VKNRLYGLNLLYLVNIVLPKADEICKWHKKIGRTKAFVSFTVKKDNYSE